MDENETIRELARRCYNFSAAILMPNGKLRKMSDYGDINNEMENLDDLMEDHDVFEDNDENYDANELEEDDAHSDNEILDDERQELQAHILDEEETASRDLLDNPVRRSNGIIRESVTTDALTDQPDCEDFTDSEDGGQNQEDNEFTPL